MFLTSHFFVNFPTFDDLTLLDKLITILGPTATGKTKLAAHLAYELDGEIISADSRQVYKKLDIGTGKDLGDYVVQGKKIPYHLIDIHEVGHEYNVYEYQEDFHQVFSKIQQRNKTAILCGGTGLYIQAILDNYKLYPVSKNVKLRQELENKSQQELVSYLKRLGPIHNTTDTETSNRTIRAIEIALYCQKNQIEKTIYPPLDYIIFGISLERSIVKSRITGRLMERLDEGMVEEVEELLSEGVTVEQLKFLGLEYKFLAQYLNNELTYEEMVKKLNIAIHQFSKRQMTWFRRMEKQGHKIHWIDGNLSVNEAILFIKSNL